MAAADGNGGDGRKQATVSVIVEPTGQLSTHVGVDR